MFNQMIHPNTGEFLDTNSPAGLKLLKHYVKLCLTQKGGGAANFYEPPSGDELENMGMNEDDWYDQWAQQGYSAGDLLAEKYEAFPVPIQSSPKQVKKVVKKKTPPKKTTKKSTGKKKKSPCRVNPKTKRCSRKGTKNRGACRVSPKGRCVKKK
jgi:hypothetical protein